MPPMAMRFLPTQEWSVRERESIGEYGIVAARHRIVAYTIAKYAHTLPFPPKTIPAKAGISQPCAANGGVNLGGDAAHG